MVAHRPVEIVTAKDGTTVEVHTYRSTTALSKAALREYMRKIERDTGVALPDTRRNDLLDSMAIDVRKDEDYPEMRFAPEF